MNTHRWISTACLSVLAVYLAACNLPVEPQPQPLSISDQAGTVVALTLGPQQIIAGTEPAATSTAGETAPAGTAAASATQSPSPTVSPTPTITPTYSPPILTITASTNCRGGPSLSFAVITVLQTGDHAQILGRFPEDDYWLVKNPHGSGNCWIWGQYSSPGGSYWTVPSVTPPPTPTSSPPAAPRNFTYHFECTFAGDVTTTLKWSDNSNNEDGFRIYRDGVPLIELPPDSTGYVDSATLAPGQSLSYSVEAFNDNGAASSATYSFSCK